jgi:hypothetical protein
MPSPAGALAKRSAPRQCAFWAVIAQIRDKVAMHHCDPSPNSPNETAFLRIRTEARRKGEDKTMMHRIFLPVVAAFALILAMPAPVEAGGGGGIGGGGIGGGGPGGFSANNLGSGNLGGGTLGHAGLGVGTGGGLGHSGLGLNPVGSGLGHGTMSYGLGGGHSSIGLGGGRAPTGQGLTSGIGTPGGDDLHLGLSSRDLGLGNNFGLNLPDNVLNRAARVPTSPLEQGIGAGGTSPQKAKDSNKGDKMGGINFDKLDRQEGRSAEIRDQELLMQEQRLEANVPQPPAPPTPAPTTAPSIEQGGPTLPEDTVVTTSLGSGEVSMIGAYFAEHGAPVASVPTSSVNVSVGGTIPENVALFPPPYDLANQVSDADFLYFVWGQSVVIVDDQTNVVTGIVPDVIAHQS